MNCLASLLKLSSEIRDYSWYTTGVVIPRLQLRLKGVLRLVTSPNLIKPLAIEVVDVIQGHPYFSVKPRCVCSTCFSVLDMAMHYSDLLRLIDQR